MSDMWLLIFDGSVRVRGEEQVKKFRPEKIFSSVNMFLSPPKKGDFFQDLKRLPDLTWGRTRNLSHFSNTYGKCADPHAKRSRLYYRYGSTHCATSHFSIFANIFFDCVPTLTPSGHACTTGLCALQTCRRKEHH